MATISSFKQSRTSPSGTTGEVQVMELELDFSSTNVSASDVVELFDIDANTVVHGTWVIVITADGETATGDIGDGASATRYSSNVDLNSADALTSSTTRHYYAAADTIDLTADHALEDGKIVVGCLVSKSRYTLT